MRGTSQENFNPAREEVYVKHKLLELSGTLRASSGMAPDALSEAFRGAEERALERHLRAITDGLRSHGVHWEEWQLEAIGEFEHVLPERDRGKALSLIGDAKAHLEEESREEALKQLELQLESSAQSYLRAAYRDEGVEVMQEPDRRREYIRELAERFSQVASDAVQDPAQLVIGRPQLEARAARAMSDVVERFGREEREALELGRLEAQMILACAIRDEASAQRPRFTDHAHFHEWSYSTRDGRGSTSLSEIWLAYNEETDPAALLVANDAERHVVRAINEVHARMAENEATRTAEAEAAMRAYEARACELSRLGGKTHMPVFEPNELTRLEDAAVATRDHELMMLVARCEEEKYGPQYAAARTMGRALRAAAIWHVEQSMPERFEYLVPAGRLDGLPEHVRESLSELLDRHRAARQMERATSLSFRENLETQASERAGQAPRTTRSIPRPLVTEAEAREIIGRRMMMREHEQRSWDRMTMYAEVAARDNRSREGQPQPLHKWALQNIAGLNPTSEYVRSIGNARVLSSSDARELVRQQAKEHGQSRPIQSRHR